MAGNFGPDDKQVLDTEQTYTVLVRPGGRLRFRFSFEAINENVALIYTADMLEKVAERGNYHRSDDDWEYSNNSAADAGFIITGWHKLAPYGPSLPWRQSTIKIFFETDKVVTVGFEDYVLAEADYNDALVTVNIWPPPPPPPKPRPPLRTYIYVGLAAAFLAGTALGIWIFNPRVPLRSAGTRREGQDSD